MADLTGFSTALNIISQLKNWFSNDSAKVIIKSTGNQSKIEYQKKVQWSVFPEITDIAEVSFQITNTGNAGAHIQSVDIGDPDADIQLTKCLTEVDGGEQWDLPPNGEAVVKTFEVAFKTEAIIYRDWIDVTFHFAIQDKNTVPDTQTITESIYIPPLSDLGK